MRRRKFIKTAVGGAVVLGSGLLGFPLGSCQGGRGGGADGGLDAKAYADLDLTEEELAQLEEMTPEEAEQFHQELEEAAADVKEQKDADGKPKLPPGQHAVDAMPSVGQSNLSPRTTDNWKFHVKGLVDKELSFTWKEFAALPHIDQVCDIHCVTTWSMFDIPWRGVRVSHLLELAGVKAAGKFVVFDCEQGYTTSLPLAHARYPTVLIADGLFGAPLQDKFGGPARGLVPHKWYYKSGNWAMGIRVVAKDEIGYWESKGYSNIADPWTPNI